MKKYIIFDFDGTLVNTNDVIVAAWQATYERFLGRAVSRQYIEKSFGETLRATAEKEFPGENAEDVMAHYRAWQVAHQKELVTIYDGIPELLTELRSRGCVIGVGTSRSTGSLLGYMQDFGIDGSVDHIVAMEDVTMHKPHPETALAVLAKMAGLPAGSEIPRYVLESAVMIGDSRFDIGCASNAGIESVLAIWGRYIGEDEISGWDWQPDHVIGTPAEFLDIV